jgi:hypothetical protein
VTRHQICQSINTTRQLITKKQANKRSNEQSNEPPKRRTERMSGNSIKGVPDIAAKEPESSLPGAFDSLYQDDTTVTLRGETPIRPLTDESVTTSFVDFTPPPAIKILPPAKYKLWLMVYVVVYFASWLAYEVDMLDVFSFNGWVDPDGASFLQFGLIVFVMIYSTIDLVIISLTLRKKDGKVYGMEAFMKAPRAQWVYKHDNFLFQLMKRIVRILEDGFSLFDAHQRNTFLLHWFQTRIRNNINISLIVQILIPKRY